MNTTKEPILGKRAATRPIFGITPFTLLDYPHRTACIFWFAGCNMRCGYCYNPEIVFGKGKYAYVDALAFLETRVGLIDAVVLSGGECTLHTGITDFAAQVKAMGFLIKADTNGSRPGIIRQLLAGGLADYVALDFKALPDRFREVTGSLLFKAFEQTLDLLIASGIGYEVRTTVHTAQLSRANLQEMVQYLEGRGYRGTYYLQRFRNGVATISDLGFSQSCEELEDLATATVAVSVRGSLGRSHTSGSEKVQE